MSKNILDKLSDKGTEILQALMKVIKKNPFESVMIALILWALLSN